jgi:clan AA aspartic protease
MGLVKQMVQLRNPRKPDVKPVAVEALVDTGALHLCIPADIAERLELDQLHTRRVGLADGNSREVPYEGPVVVEVLGRECFTGAIVMGNEVLLGSVPKEDMDLWISPSLHKLVPNPASPDVPMSVAKGFRALW